MRFEDHPELATEIAFLANQPLPISLIHWNRFLGTLDTALRDEFTRGIEAAPHFAERDKVLGPEPPTGCPMTEL